MNSRTLIVALGAGVLAFGMAAPAAADDHTVSYVEALEAAELIAPDGDPRFQFRDGDSAVFTGRWVCQQVEQGRSRDSIVYELDHSDGMLLSPHDAVILFDAATTYLC